MVVRRGLAPTTDAVVRAKALNDSVHRVLHHVELGEERHLALGFVVGFRRHRVRQVDAEHYVTRRGLRNREMKRPSRKGRLFVRQTFQVKKPLRETNLIENPNARTQRTGCPEGRSCRAMTSV